MSPAPRRWLEVSVRAPSGDEATGVVVDRLLALGCGGALERDGRVVGYLPDPADPAAVEGEVRARLRAALGPERAHVSVRWLAQEDWSEAWKAGLAPRRVGKRLVVTPSWMRPERRDDDVLVVIDPGMAFGTAEHGTTRGCLRLLEGALSPGEHMLDVGAGSGILAVAAALLGAGRVVAVEADGDAHGTLLGNVESNGVQRVVACLARRADAALLAGLGPVDGVTANIEARVLLSLAPGFHAALRSGGWLVLSGVLAGEWQGFSRVIEAAGFHARAVDADGDWRSGLFERAGA